MTQDVLDAHWMHIGKLLLDYLVHKYIICPGPGRQCHGAATPRASGPTGTNETNVPAQLLTM